MKARFAAAPLAISVALLAAAPATATTFCVPTFHAACPNSGGNVAEADLETALQANGSDDVADKVVIAPGTYTEPDSLDTGGTDPLEIVGAGPADTVLTTTSTGNIFVVNLAAGSRSSTTVRNLRIVVPASLPDGLGSGLQANKALLENVDIEVRNPGSDAAPSLVGGGTVRDSRIYTTGDGVIQSAIKGNAAGSGALTIERTTISGARYAITTTTAAVPVFVRRSAILDPVFAAVWVRDGGFAVVENTIVRTAGGIPLDVTSNNASTPIATLRNSTLVRTGGDDFPAVKVHATGTASTNVQVSSTIARGFQTGYDRQAPVSEAVGDANLSISHSNIVAAGISNGDGTLGLASNIDADPLFESATDYRLRAGSPSIDNGSPSAVDPVVDFDGLGRPFDGDGDGVARRDQGAYEYRPPAPSLPPGGGQPPSGNPAPTADPLVVTVGKLKGTKLTVTVSGAGKVRVTQAPKSGKKLLKRASKTAAKAGKVVVKLKLTKLARSWLAKKGKFTVKARIVFTAKGGGSKAKTKKLTVKK
jgi:hypothetical protein